MMLYIRMIITMGVTLYTSRVVLAALGVEDYGIYSIVGGVVSMFTMISGSLSTAISRFITFELGKGNQERLNTIFSTSIIIQFILSVVIVLLVESVGVWFLNNELVIPEGRIEAARWVLHFSTITLIINLISIPYNAAIIAHERMSAFAYISILDAVGKLAIAYFIAISPIDKLVFYAIMMSTVALIVRITYGIYCSRHFEECRHFRPQINRDIFKEMFAFAGWQFFGTSSHIIRDQGGNILLNIFGGPALNAARGISVQVMSAVTLFSSNFMTALNPQIVKSYACGDRSYMMTLIFQGSRLSFYMLLTLSIPILLNTQYILGLWLVDVPAHTVLFVQLALIFGIIRGLQTPLIQAIFATGDIRNVQLIVGFLQASNLPISYLLLKRGLPPEIVLIVAIGMSCCTLITRLIMLRRMIGLPVQAYASKVLFNIASVAAVATIIPIFIAHNMECNLGTFVLVSLVSLLCTAISIYFVGCNSAEREFIITKIKMFRRRL